MGLDSRNNVGVCIKKDFFHLDTRLITPEPEVTFWKIERWSAAAGKKNLETGMRGGPRDSTYLCQYI